MKKIRILLTFILTYSLSYGVLVDTCVQTSIKNHAHFFSELNALSGSFYVTKETWSNICTYTCHCDEYTAKKIEEYLNAFNDLYVKVAVNNAGNGFIFGILLALGNTSLSYETINNKTAISAILGITTLVLLQRYEIGHIPYFDEFTLEKQDNLLGIGETINNMVLMAIGTSSSYFGTDYIITKILNTSL